ncbi:hypothetical protein B0H13DRAFT_2573976, partial [Mycena leptocephala]
RHSGKCQEGEWRRCESPLPSRGISNRLILPPPQKLKLEPNAVVTDMHQMYRDECRLNDALQAKCTGLEAQVKESAELAAKALRERVDAEKVLEGMRRESKVLTKEMQDLRTMYAELQTANDVLMAEKIARDEANDAAMTILRNKYQRVKEERTGLRASSEEMSSQLVVLAADKEELKQTLREMIELVESLQEEVKENADLVEMVSNLSEQYKESTEARVELHERCVSLECIIDQLMYKKRRAQVREKYLDFMKNLPSPETPLSLPVLQLEPICYSKTNLHLYLSQDPGAKSFLNHVLYLPKRILSISDSHYIAYGPTHRYDRAAASWMQGSDLTSFHGGTRELFVNYKEFVLYAGSYKCHDLRALQPEGIALPGQISQSEIMDAAVGVPRPANHVQILNQQYPDGAIQVEATGLQRVGFNTQLYDSLRRRFTEECANGKRKAGSEDLRKDKKTKAQK